MNHLTPEELAREEDTTTEEILEQCVALGVPIVHGRIDRSLFHQASSSIKSKEENS